jgi:DeoR/GlpR family transcriptional regulator of sugar metabolism
VKDRQEKIYEYIKNVKSVSTKELKEHFFISESTLRRDLTKMEQKGLIQRTHGHASIIESQTKESALSIRINTMVKEKTIIAGLAERFLESNKSFFVDSSSTAGYLLPAFKKLNDITIITNGLNNASILTNIPSVKIYLPCGTVYSNTNSILGIDTVKHIKSFNCNIFIFSCAGISIESGITEASHEQALVKNEMIKNSKTHILLVDHSKFDRIFMCTSCSFEDIDIIVTDKKPSDKYIEHFKSHNITLIYP